MEKDVKKAVRNNYAKIAKGKGSCCDSKSSCCSKTDMAQDISKKIGYSEKELSSVPEGSNLGLGCGNPTALASLKEGEIVLDLGSGAGFDCFLAANKVGKNGKIIGVDMTPEMIDKARKNAVEGNYDNVEFRLGEIENLPVADNYVDVIISNCVINLATDKKRVFDEAFRAIKPGGRMMISDMVLLNKLPDSIMNSITAYVGCISGAMMKDEYIETIKSAGFREVKIIDETFMSFDCMANDPTAQSIVENSEIPIEKIKEIANSISSIKVYGIK